MDAPDVHLSGKRIFVAGHRGMAGAAIVKRLARENCEILTIARRELDLTRQAPTERWLEANRPDIVIVAAARVGGILANSNYPVDFLSDNLAMEVNLIRASYAINVKKLLFLGSTCIYPKLSKQPMSEDQLLTGTLEPSNQWYSIAKIAGIKLCEAYRQQFGCDFVSVMPTNLYGPNDNYHPDHAHVIAALIQRFHKAKCNNAPTVVVWGTGTPLREFLYVDDFADACVFVIKRYSGKQFLNIGCGEEVTIAHLAELIADVVGYRGDLVFDPTKPDGTPRKLVDISKLSALGWRASVPLRKGLELSYADFLKGNTRSR